MTSPPPSITVVERPNAGWDARLRVFQAGDEVATCVLVTERFTVLVDTMATPALAGDLLAAVRPSLLGRQLLVINTHADWDHCWGNGAFDGPHALHPAPIIGHALAAERLTGVTEQRTLKEKQRESSRFASVRLVPPALTFTEGLRIRGGDLTLEVLHTPGHTPDHVVVWVPELRLLLAGDAAEDPLPCVHSAAELPRQRRSLERLVALDPALVIPCHGAATDPGLPRRNLAYFAALEGSARRALARNALPPDWAARADLPEIIDLPIERALMLAGVTASEIREPYPTFHNVAARTMLEWLQTTEQV